MLRPGKSYDEVYDSFKWRIPDSYNIGIDICDKHAQQKDRLALIYETEDGRVTKYSFNDLKRFSNQFANALRAKGIQNGDRLGILLPQSLETAIAHIATYKAGCVAIPLFTLLDPTPLSIA